MLVLYKVSSAGGKVFLSPLVDVSPDPGAGASPTTKGSGEDKGQWSFHSVACSRGEEDREENAGPVRQLAALVEIRVWSPSTLSEVHGVKKRGRYTGTPRPQVQQQMSTQDVHAPLAAVVTTLLPGKRVKQE